MFTREIVYNTRSRFKPKRQLLMCLHGKTYGNARLDEMFSSPTDRNNKEPRSLGPTENNSPVVNGNYYYKIFAYRTETHSFSHNFVFFILLDTTQCLRTIYGLS